MTTTFRSGMKHAVKFGALGALVLALSLLAAPSEASAQWGISAYSGYGGYSAFSGNGYGYRFGSGYGYNNGPIYHGPSMHYDRVYHATPHWTPWRGWHTHGHYDYVPHYTPGHYDHLHGDHVHGNPHFHHD